LQFSIIIFLKYYKFINKKKIGCGTGQAGAWLKDYAKTLTGVDISSEMLKMAKKKNLYNDLFLLNIDKYFDEIIKFNEDNNDNEINITTNNNNDVTKNVENISDNSNNNDYYYNKIEIENNNNKNKVNNNKILFDVIVAADVIAYIGDLSNFFYKV
jgi:predicted TPR repeat methyltransferase